MKYSIRPLGLSFRHSTANVTVDMNGPLQTDRFLFSDFSRHSFYATTKVAHFLWRSVETNSRYTAWPALQRILLRRHNCNYGGVLMERTAGLVLPPSRSPLRWAKEGRSEAASASPCRAVLPPPAGYRSSGTRQLGNGTIPNTIPNRFDTPPRLPLIHRVSRLVFARMGRGMRSADMRQMREDVR
jgi:hypothetical protein